MSQDDDTDDTIDKGRRRLLVTATSAVAAMGLAATAVPFVSSMLPSEKAKAEGGPVRVKVGEMKVGDQMTVIWRGRPVWIVHRGKSALATLPKLSGLLRDPDSTVPQQPIAARNLYRSIKPELLVLVGICTHLGCSPTYRPDPKSIDPEWPGGFYCSCHGSKFDLAGRVYKGVPAPVNLEVPPYVYINDDELLVGVEKLPA